MDNLAGFINLSRSLYITRGSEQRSRKKKEIGSERRGERWTEMRDGGKLAGAFNYCIIKVFLPGDHYLYLREIKYFSSFHNFNHLYRDLFDIPQIHLTLL